jgi:hypothetical protein
VSALARCHCRQQQQRRTATKLRFGNVELHVADQQVAITTHAASNGCT